MSLLGSEVTLLALPLTGVLVLHASAAQVALLAAAGTLPFLLLGLPAGVWVDRWPRRRVMVVTDLVRAALLASVPIAAVLDGLTLPHLYAVAFGTGICAVFFDVTALSVLPAIVAAADLPSANGRLEAARATAQTTGPAVGGALVQVLTAPVALVVDAVSYAVSALLLRGIGQVPGPPRAPGGLLRGVGEGLRFCFRHPHIRVLAAGAAWINFWTEALMAVFLTYAVRELDQSAGAIGLVLAAANLGYLTGSMLVPRLNRVFGVGVTIAVGVALNIGLVLVAVAPASAPLPWLVAGFTLHTMGSAVWNVNAVSLRQASTPQPMLARMNATNRFLIWGTMPLGAAAGGLLAATFGLGPAVTVAAVAVPLCAVPLLRSSLRSVRAMPTPEPGSVGS